MKNESYGTKALGWLWGIVVPILALIYPEFGDVEEINEAYYTVAGIGGLVATGTQALKKIFGYDPESHSRVWPVVMSIFSGILLSLLGFAGSVGIFATIEAFTVFNVIILGVLIAGVANLFYNIPLLKQLYKVMFGIQLPEEK